MKTSPSLLQLEIEYSEQGSVCFLSIFIIHCCLLLRQESSMERNFAEQDFVHTNKPLSKHCRGRNIVRFCDVQQKSSDQYIYKLTCVVEYMK